MTTGVSRARDPRVDRVKAGAILVVPLIHAGPNLWAPGSTPTDVWLRSSWTIFAVPAFVMMSGWLHRAEDRPIAWPLVRRRMERVLVPYLVCCAVLYATGVVPLGNSADALVAVATGGTYGIYYYVPIILSCIAASWLLSRLSRPVLWVLVAVLAAYASALSWSRSLWFVTFWGMRDPFGAFWLGFYVLGWLACMELVAERLPRLLLVSLVGAFVALVTPPAPTYVLVPYAIAVVALLWSTPLAFPGMRLLSDASLAIYLWHYPLSLALQARTPTWPPPVRILTVWLLPLAATVAGCLAARALLGRERARYWIGA